MPGNFKVCKDPKLIISFLSILLFLSEYLCCFSLKSFNVIFFKEAQMVFMYMGAITNPKPRITAPFRLLVTYAKSSCIFEGRVVMVLSTFLSKTVIKKKRKKKKSVIVLL